jgi:hypothetical protein
MEVSPSRLLCCEMFGEEVGEEVAHHVIQLCALFVRVLLCFSKMGGFPCCALYKRRRSLNTPPLRGQGFTLVEKALRIGTAKEARGFTVVAM